MCFYFCFAVQFSREEKKKAKSIIVFHVHQKLKSLFNKEIFINQQEHRLDIKYSLESSRNQGLGPSVGTRLPKLERQNDFLP